MGCGASSGNPPLSDTKMRLISEMPPQKRRDCEDTFSALDKDGNGTTARMLKEQLVTPTKVHYAHTCAQLLLP